MKKFSRLMLVEADALLEPLLPVCQSVIESLYNEPVEVLEFQEAINTFSVSPQLILVNSNLVSMDALRQYVDLQQKFPHSAIILVADKQDDDLYMMALEAGAEDVITRSQLTKKYLYKASIVSQRRYVMENELSQSKAQFLACIQNTPNVAVQWYNSRGEVLFWNRASEKTFGWTANEVKGKTIGQLMITPGEEKQFIETLNKLKNTDAPSDPSEYIFRRRDGSEGCCISTLFRIESFNEEPWFVCMDVDITDRKRMEKALVQSEEKYRLLVEQQADAITIFDQSGKILEVNSSACQLLKYSREELQCLTLLDLLVPEDLRRNPISFDQLKQGYTTIKQRKMLCKDGSVVETEVHAKLIGNGLFLASVRDLTERIEVQRRLQKEIELSDSIINGLPHLFYLFTKEGKYLRWNRHLQTISGFSEEEIAEITPLHFFGEEDKPIIIDAIEKVYANGQFAVEANLLTKDGRQIPHYFTGLTVDYAGSQCLMGVGIDLSAVKTLEKELSQQKIAEQKKIMQAMIRAEEKEKNKLGLELHDNVNQILSVVRMYLTILDSENPMEEVTLAKTIQLLNSAIDEIRHLSHSLAVSYKFEAGLIDALEDMVEKISVTRDFSISLCTSQDLDECTNNEQKLAIYRIVQEQLNNVIKYAKATEVKIEIQTSAEAISLAIQDNGQGFNPAKAGKGLGLSNITTRAESLEGKVCIHSAPGQGCRMMVTLPVNVAVVEEEV